MSVTAPHQPQEIPAPVTIADAIAHARYSAHAAERAIDKLLKLEELRQQTPEIRPIVINSTGSGPYQVVDTSAWVAKSIGILNPSSAIVYIGVGGVSARPGRTPSCPAEAVIVLPIEAQDLELGCDSTVIGTSTVVLYLLRFVTVQPLTLGDMT